MLGVLGQPEDVGLRKSVEYSGSYSFYSFYLKVILRFKGSASHSLKFLEHLKTLNVNITFQYYEVSICDDTAKYVLIHR